MRRFPPSVHSRAASRVSFFPNGLARPTPLVRRVGSFLSGGYLAKLKAHRIRRQNHIQSFLRTRQSIVGSDIDVRISVANDLKPFERWEQPAWIHLSERLARFNFCLSQCKASHACSSKRLSQTRSYQVAGKAFNQLIAKPAIKHKMQCPNPRRMNASIHLSARADSPWHFRLKNILFLHLSSGLKRCQNCLSIAPRMVYPPNFGSARSTPLVRRECSFIGCPRLPRLEAQECAGVVRCLKASVHLRAAICVLFFASEFRGASPDPGGHNPAERSSMTRFTLSSVIATQASRPGSLDSREAAMWRRRT